MKVAITTPILQVVTLRLRQIKCSHILVSSVFLRNPWTIWRLLRVLWTTRRPNQSILKEISPEYSLERLMLKLKLLYFGNPMQRAVVQLLSRFWLFVTPHTAAHQASLSFTISQSLLKLMSVELVKSWLIGKDSDAGKDRRQEEKGMTEDEMFGWHHQLNRHEFE